MDRKMIEGVRAALDTMAELELAQQAKRNAEAKEAAERLAAVEEGKFKDIVIKKQDKAMGAKPVPTKKKEDVTSADKKPENVRGSDGKMRVRMVPVTKRSEAKMDPVGKADADIDNDGDVDKSDEYLHNRRKAIKKAMKKEDMDIQETNKEDIEERISPSGTDRKSILKKAFRAGKSKAAQSYAGRDNPHFDRDKDKLVKAPKGRSKDKGIKKAYDAGRGQDQSFPNVLRGKGQQKPQDSLSVGRSKMFRPKISKPKGKLPEEFNESLIKKAANLVKSKKADRDLTKNLKATIDHHKSEHKEARKNELEYNKSKSDLATTYASKGDTHKAMAGHAQDALNAHRNKDTSGVKKHMDKYKSLSREHVKKSDVHPVSGLQAHPMLPSHAHDAIKHVSNMKESTDIRSKLMSIWEDAAEINEADRAAHYKGATKPENMPKDDARSDKKMMDASPMKKHGKGAKEDPESKKAEDSTKPSAMRNNDNKQGDKAVMKSATPDHPAHKTTKEQVEEIKAAYESMYEKEDENGS